LQFSAHIPNNLLVTLFLCKSGKYLLNNDIKAEADQLMKLNEDTKNNLKKEAYLPMQCFCMIFATTLTQLQSLITLRKERKLFKEMNVDVKECYKNRNISIVPTSGLLNRAALYAADQSPCLAINNN